MRPLSPEILRRKERSSNIENGERNDAAHSPEYLAWFARNAQVDLPGAHDAGEGSVGTGERR